MTDVFSYTHPTGHVFSPSERVALATSLPLLATTIKKRNLFLWGKIFGYQKDYIIVKAFGDDLVAGEPELFYSVDEGLAFTLLGTTTSLMQEIARQDEEQCSTRNAANGGATSQQKQPFINMNDALDVQEKKMHILKQMQGSFMGDPAYEYRILANSSNGPSTPGSPNSAAIGNPEDVKSFKESVRLALFVEEHDYNCRVAPRGAYYKNEKNVSEPPAAGGGTRGGNSVGDIRRNAAFQGLKKANGEAVSLRFYYHIRQLDPYRRFLNSSDHASGALYFTSGNNEKNAFERMAENQKIDAHFEALAVDVPTGIWRLKFDPMANLVTGSHAYFPGSLFYHVPETAVYGTIYMGDGTINNDVAFEI